MILTLVLYCADIKTLICKDNKKVFVNNLFKKNHETECYRLTIFLTTQTIKTVLITQRNNSSFTGGYLLKYKQSLVAMNNYSS